MGKKGIKKLDQDNKHRKIITTQMNIYKKQ